LLSCGIFTKARAVVLNLRASCGPVKSGSFQENTLSQQSCPSRGRKIVTRICEIRTSRLGRHADETPTLNCVKKIVRFFENELFGSSTAARGGDSFAGIIL
jgi:hypothetical protein